MKHDAAKIEVANVGAAITAACDLVRRKACEEVIITRASTGAMIARVVYDDGPIVRFTKAVERAILNATLS